MPKDKNGNVNYASDKQRKFMHAVHPEIAKRWDAEIRRDRKKKSR